MESTPAVLQWLLDHRPQGFPFTTLPLWQITSCFLKLIRFSRGSNVGSFMHLLGPMMEATAALSTAYLLYLESCTANRSVVEPISDSIIFCRLGIMSIVGNTVLPDVTATSRMLASRAVQELAICMVVCFCQQQHAEHLRRQQGQLQQQQQQRGGRSGRSRNSGGGAITASSFSSSSTFADLVIPPDHESVTVAGGQYAVALHTKRVLRHMQGQPGVDTVTGLAMTYLHRLARAAADDSTNAMVNESATEPLQLTLRPTQQLLLELIALLWSAGAQKEGLDCMLTLLHSWDNTQAEGVGALVGARGPLLLQVLFLALKEGWAAQQQGLFPSNATDNLLLCTVGACLWKMQECKIITRLGLGVHSRVLSFPFEDT